ncbi:MAG: hypothetical protein WC725_03860 [Patescibacteria group bacterium]|jgi:hypothetical protein
MENYKPINFSLEKMKRSYLPEFIKEFEDDILKGEFNGEDLSTANFYLQKAYQALEDLKQGNFENAKEIINYDIQRLEGWTKVLAEESLNIDQISKTMLKIEHLKQLREEFLKDI